MLSLAVRGKAVDEAPLFGSLIAMVSFDSGVRPVLPPVRERTGGGGGLNSYELRRFEAPMRQASQRCGSGLQLLHDPRGSHDQTPSRPSAPLVPSAASISVSGREKYTFSSGRTVRESRP